VEQTAAVLTEVLSFEFRQAFLPYRQPTPPGYLHDYHFHRVWRRIALSIEMDPAFRYVIEAPWLEVRARPVPLLRSPITSLAICVMESASSHNIACYLRNGVSQIAWLLCHQWARSPWTCVEGERTMHTHGRISSHSDA
jgi:hypothetical protein